MLEFSSTYELLEKLPDEQSCIKYFTAIRWQHGEYCPYCNCEKIYHFSDNKTHKCATCKKRFSIKVGTIFDDSKIPLRKWFLAIFMMTTHKKGLSSLQLARDIKVTQKTAWFMMHRIREATQLEPFRQQLNGTIEVDETYVGGQEKNKHSNKKIKHTQGRSNKTKSIVLGMLQRDGYLKAKMVEDVTSKTIEKETIKNVVLGSIVMSDEWKSYQVLDNNYSHHVVNHSKGQFAIDNISTNTIESFWAVFKRGLKGVYHIMSKKHLDRYIQEFVFRWNLRNEERGLLFNSVLNNAKYKLSYKNLINV